MPLSLLFHTPPRSPCLRLGCLEWVICTAARLIGGVPRTGHVFAKCKMFFTGYLSSTRSYSVFLPWSGGVISSPDISPGLFPTEKNANNVVEIEARMIKQYFSSRSWLMIHNLCYLEAGLMKDIYAV